MKTRIRAAIVLGLAGIFILSLCGSTQRDLVEAQGRKPVYINRIYTGPDGLSHIEKLESNFTNNPELISDISKMMPITGAELRRSTPGHGNDKWHVGPQRQYIITLSGQGEIEVAGGEKLELGPGVIELIEDTTGKGHITRTFGYEDRVSLWLPLADQSGKDNPKK